LHIHSSEIAARGAPLASTERSHTWHYSTKPRVIFPRGPSYPEGNFEGNQLLGGSMSLSPLYRVLTNDLHVSTARPTSIAVSSDFVVTRHRSPPFGSHRTRSHSTGVLRTASPSVFAEGRKETTEREGRKKKDEGKKGEELPLPHHPPVSPL